MALKYILGDFERDSTDRVPLFLFDVLYGVVNRIPGWIYLLKVLGLYLRGDVSALAGLGSRIDCSETAL